MSEHQRGFSLMELLIALIIIGILSAVAIPTYSKYTLRAHFSELVMAAQPYKIAVLECFTVEGSLTNCNGGNFHSGVPDNITKGADTIKTLTVKQGVISITPNTQNGLQEKDTYILTPTVTGNRLKWKTSGGAVKAGLTK